MIIEIDDMHTPVLSSIARINRNVAFEQMSKIGNKIRVNAKKKMNMQRHRHSWMVKSSKNGKRINYYSSSEQKNLGWRTAPDGSSKNPQSMGNLISSNLMEKSGVLIVGGKNAGKQVMKRKDGKPAGWAFMPAVTAHSQSIIHKLDTGSRVVGGNGSNKTFHHGWGFKGNDKESAIEGARFKGRGFMKDAFNATIPYMKSNLTTEYEKIVGRVVNTTVVRLTPIRRVV